MIWGIFAIMAIAGLTIALFPMRRAGMAPVLRADAVPAVLVDQLEEIDRDMARGLVSAPEAEAARQEIRRRMAQVLRRADRQTVTTTGGRGALILAAVFVPAMAFGYYSFAGAPDVPAVAFADRADERADTRRIADLAGQLRERLRADPDGGPTDGWMLLGQTYARMGQFDEAVTAFRTASGRDDAVSATWSMLAEAMIRANDGTVTPDAVTALNRALTLDLSNPAAAFYLAIADAQAGEVGAAHDRLTARLAETPGYQPWMDTYIAQANAFAQTLGRAPIASRAPVARSPSAADVAAAQEMSEGDRAVFIRSMVDRLATRLEDEPDDVNGWLRLANAYGVLQEMDKARDAYLRADALLPEGDARKAEVRASIARLENP
ncbi:MULTISPECIES: c-type cytochrome biogenesis protein CcmI [Tropicibacter]|uniref:Formate-dependent nitrite reductase complex subunit NrfG n=1 Tax=Tropicibacter naphthalenivorans TaxID=441103 RepID=A0A0P1GYC4_9RHOB|nr:MULTISPECIES: c-type cytochrome biogenesis protein CcmI [Tropicibacter]CUH81906.1 formate-dependent nitrite reductase complex subunit NrfG [Tropicibacter naphthalenivorans]SMD02371.1 cytochrome c-type biogenesis protein CcmH [Tropicibacter naphthalenivorans]